MSECQSQAAKNTVVSILNTRKAAWGTPFDRNSGEATAPRARHKNTLFTASCTTYTCGQAERLPLADLVQGYSFNVSCLNKDGEIDESKMVTGTTIEVEWAVASAVFVCNASQPHLINRNSSQARKFQLRHERKPPTRVSAALRSAAYGTRGG